MVGIRALAGVASCGASVFLLFGDDIEGKVSDNENLSGLGGFAGVAPLAVSLIMLAALKSKGRDIIENHLALLAMLALQIIAFIISRYYYVGLRLQGLFRSEEHTSELQSLMRISYAVFCLKKKIYTLHIHTTYKPHHRTQSHYQ